jgi:hypothetical protein
MSSSDEYAPGSLPALQSVKMSIASADILTLHTTPVVIIPAPGAGKVINVLSVQGRMNFLTAAYATNTELDIVDTTSSSKLFGDTAALLSSAGNLVAQIPAEINSNGGITITPNGSVSVTVATGDPTAGAGSLDLYVIYQVVTL